jgi:uncharacterized protein YjcR
MLEKILSRFEGRKLREEFNAGVGLKILRERYGVSEKTVLAIARGKAYTYRDDPLNLNPLVSAKDQKYKGKESSKRSRKLTKSQASDVKKDIGKGWTLERVARKYGVSCATIKAIRDGERYFTE